MIQSVSPSKSSPCSQVSQSELLAVCHLKTTLQCLVWLLWPSLDCPWGHRLTPYQRYITGVEVHKVVVWPEAVLAYSKSRVLSSLVGQFKYQGKLGNIVATTATCVLWLLDVYVRTSSNKIKSVKKFYHTHEWDIDVERSQTHIPLERCHLKPQFFCVSTFKSSECYP